MAMDGVSLIHQRLYAFIGLLAFGVQALSVEWPLSSAWIALSLSSVFLLSCQMGLKEKQWQFFLLAQTIGVSASVIISDSGHTLPLILLPFGAGVLLPINKEWRWRASILISIGSFVLGVCAVVWKHYPHLSQQSIFMTVAIGILYCFVFLDPRYQYDRSQPVDQESDIKDRYFFHDLVNQVHGLWLFLNFKAETKTPVAHNEVESLLREMKVLLSMLKEHFPYQHKNLTNLMGDQNLKQLLPELNLLLAGLLPRSQCEVKVEIDKMNESDYVIDTVLFWRVVVNLVKNASESSAKKITLKFTINRQGCPCLEVRNSLNDSSLWNESGLAVDKQQRYSLGLETVHHHLEEVGGQFHVKVEDREWVCHVTFPHKNAVASQAA